MYQNCDITHLKVLLKTYEETSRGDKSLFESNYFHYVGHGAECNRLT